MAEAIAVILEVEGDVWARSADGEMRMLRAGDTVFAGETVVTAQGARVELDLSNGDTVQLASGQSLLISPEMLAEAEPSADEQAVTDPGVAEVLALLEGDGDILEELEAPAAGTTGGDAGGGRTLVEVTRIVEQIDPLAFNFADPTRVPNEPTPGVTGVAAADEAVEPVEPTEPTAPEETTPAITVNLDDQNAETVTESLISGTTTKVEAGQTVSITVTDGDNTVTTSAIVQSDGSYQVVEDLSSLSDGELTATATVSDQAGNEATDTDTALLDTQAEATITIDTIAGDDVINEEESGETITITGSVGGDAGEGDTVTLTVGGVTYEGSVDNGGNYAIDVPGSQLADNSQVDASVSGTDDSGNPFSTDATREYAVDTQAEAAITIDTIAGDDVINEEESGETITITGSVGGDAGEGDTVTLTVGGVTYEGSVDNGGNYAIDVPGSQLADNSQVDASVSGTDDSGNPFSADNSREYSVDTEAEAAITIDTIAGDDVINEEESGETITITGSVGGDAGEGDTVTLTVGGVTYEGSVDNGGNYAIDVPGSQLADNSQVDASVSGTDDSGNPFSADNSREYAVDTEASATISIDTIAGDDVINEEESGETITITGSVGGDAGEGDTVTLTVGGETFEGTVDADNNYAIDVPGSLLAANDTVSATVTGSDDAGNDFTASAGREYGVDTAASATITIDPVTGDDLIDGDEAGQKAVSITGSVGGDASEGDTVTLTVGGQEFTGTVDADHNYAIDVPGSLLAANDTVSATVTGSDDAGNDFTASAGREYGVDTAASATITIDPVTGDDLVDGDEAGEKAVSITGSVGGDASEGDTVTLTIGGQEFTGTVDADNNYAIDVPGSLLAANDTVSATVTGSDDAGNDFTASAGREYGVDTAGSATITIDPVTGDDLIDGDEAGQEAISITGSVGGDASEGDTVTLTVGGQEFTGTVDADNNYAIDVPGSLLAANDTVSATVTGSDDAGNDFTASAGREYGVDTEASATITIDPVTGDDLVDGDEAGQEAISITGSVGGDATEGDTVTLTVGGEKFTGTVDGDNEYTIDDVPGSLLADNDTVHATVTGSDDAGNDFTASAAREYALNTPPVADPVLTTAEVFDADSILPDGVSASPLLFKQFSVDGTVDGNDPEASPTLGGADAETPLDDLTFTLDSVPDSGALFIDVDGDGTYAPAQQGTEFSDASNFYWMDDGSGSNAVNIDFSQAPVADSGITVFAYGYDGEQDNTLLNYGNDGVGAGDDSPGGIQQQVPNQLGYRDGTSQTLVMDFDGPAHGAEISVSRLIKTEGEVGQVDAYLDGEQVGTWTFSGVDGATLDGEPVDFDIGGNNGSFNLPDGIAFDQLRFTATEYADGHQSNGSGNDSSDYFVDSISYKTFSAAEFLYSVKDGDGDGSDPVKVEINVPETNTEVPTSFETGGPSIIVLDPEGTTVNEAFLDNGTRAGEEPAEGEPGKIANGQFTLNTPAGLGALSIAAASLTSGDASFADDQVSLDADQLAALNDTPVVIETPEGNTLRLTGFDADSGTVDYEFELGGPVTNENGEPLNKEPISLELTDANGTPAQATLNVAILDDGVDTTDDLLAVTAGDDAAGNVLDNDAGADVDLALTAVTFEGIAHQVPENGDPITIRGDYGTLTTERDGSYSYQANAVEPVNIQGSSAEIWETQTAGLWGFDASTTIPLEGDGGLDLTALSAGNGNITFNGGEKSGVGVKVKGGANTIDDGESILIQLEDSTDQLTVGINRFNEAQEKFGFWTAYNDDGDVVGSGGFSGVNNNGDRFELAIETTESFSYLQMGLDTGDVNNNSGYVIDELSYTPTHQFEQDSFTYTVEDQDGSTAEGTLSAFMHSDDLTPVIGTEGDDALLVGGDADEAFAGLAGDDTLTGGLGDDVFKWTLADQGDTNAPANDVITDFGTGNDVLDLRDLLVDETEQPIGDFLSVAQDGDDLVFQVTHDGGSDGATQTITLQDKSFSDFGGATNSDELIQNMLDSGQLKIDT